VVEQFPSDSESETSIAGADVGRSVDDLVQSQADLAQSRKDLAQSQADLAQSRHDLAESRADLVAANELSDHLQEPLRTSRQIGMAIGILMERHKLTAEQAFDHLRVGSSRRNVKLRDIAEQLLFTGEDPTQINA
jgi:phage terminase Nu1 subunit (DNA packaging protein)